MKMRVIVLGAALVAVPAFAVQSGSETSSRPNAIILYQDVNFGGASVAIAAARPSVRTPWSIRSLSIHPGEAWQVCERPQFREPCVILSRSVHDASIVGIDRQVGSIRPASEARGH